MKAEEIYATVDSDGKLNVEQLFSFRNKKVKLIILAQEDDITDEEWIKFLSINPAFDFLKDEAEDIYTIQDGNLTTVKGEIVLVPFPYDDFSKLKVRPAVCLTNEIGYYNQIIIAFITSNIPVKPENSDVLLSTSLHEFNKTG